MTEITILKGNLAKEKWKEGREAWNNWVSENSEAHIDFSGLHFGENDKTERPIHSSYNIEWKKIYSIDFKGFKFPNGDIKFDNCTFDADIIDFSDSIFGSGELNFNYLKFNSRRILFKDAVFKSKSIRFYFDSLDSYIDYSGVNFGDGDVDFNVKVSSISFSDSEFGSGKKSFSNSVFKSSSQFIRKKFGDGDGDGDVNFSHCNFGSSNVSFDDAIFGNGEIDFTYAEFGGDLIRFRKTNFGDGDIFFMGATFKNDVLFYNAHFGKGHTLFTCAKFYSTDIKFQLSYFQGDADFTALGIGNECKSLSFKQARFESSFAMSFACLPKLESILKASDSVWNDDREMQNIYNESVRICFVPDLTRTKVNSHVDLYDLFCQPEFKKDRFFNKAKNKGDAAKLCRLKELAENNKHHEAARRFFADEMRVKRWNDNGLLISLAELLYDIFSSHGQSIIKPFFWFSFSFLFLFFYTIGYSLFSHNWLDNMLNINAKILTDGFILTLYKTVLFLPFVKKETQSAFDSLDGCGILSEYYYIVSIITSFFSFIFTFLIGLGLRNRFRL
ncbi:hypothetical protein A1OW_14975 [Enterovibrio norvegicus]|uniref:pentapeptide repeat-containing protein n=1 Tax=Enterovibrio norvegicus TaxID=188144 RepID=UPI0002E361DE|nr:pentapeptide repeat-containing protein [Enterovibrio norvegicus]OEF48564.1 hypothetical protein A1OW_14975 [Enterovibrio norvegicus]